MKRIKFSLQIATEEEPLPTFSVEVVIRRAYAFWRKPINILNFVHGRLYVLRATTKWHRIHTVEWKLNWSIEYGRPTATT